MTMSSFRRFKVTLAELVAAVRFSLIVALCGAFLFRGRNPIRRGG